MRIAVFQGPLENAGVAPNLRLLGEQAAQAAARGAGLLVCPEMFLTGYAIGPRRSAGWPSPWTARRPPGRPRSRGSTGVALLYGYPGAAARTAASTTAALLVDRDGRRLANHRKTHLFGDARPRRLRRRRGAADRGRAGRAQARHPDLLRCRVPGERAAAGAAGRGAGGGADRQHGALPLRLPRAGARARLREPSVPRLRQSLRPRGRAGVSGPVLHRRHPTARTSRAPALARS